jgi:hypothetical protein
MSPRKGVREMESSECEETLGVALARDRLCMEKEFSRKQAENAARRIADAEKNLREELKNQEILRGSHK